MTSDPLPAVVAGALVASGLVLATGGTLVAARTAARAAGALFGAAGALAVLAGVSAALGRSPWAGLAIAGTLLGLAVIAFPRIHGDVPTLLATLVLLGLAFAQWSVDQGGDPTGLALLIAAVPLIHVWWRLEMASHDESRALSWVLTSATPVLFAGMVVAMLQPSPLVVAVYLLSVGAISWAAWIGASRPAAVDVRGLVATLATNTLAAVAVFTTFQLGAIALEAMGAISSTSPITAIAAAACSFLLSPLRRLLRLIADEFLFGVRPDPMVAAGRVALGVGDDTQAALDTLCTALVLPFAELRIDGFEVTTSGELVEHTHVEALRADRRQVGTLVIGLRPGDLSLPDADAVVVALAAPLLAQTVWARALAERLQEARSATASAREEERRRLRRDLHDGLGPRLSGIAFTADAAQLSTQDPDLLEVHLARVRSEAVAAIREIREIVHGLRPPALDEVGLVEAVRLQSTTVIGAGGKPLVVEVHGHCLPELPAAVEVAAYRIATEAVTNSARHSGADHAWVTFRAGGGALHIEIGDTGNGAGPWDPGVGLRSMAERAQELGGSLNIERQTVRAVIPIQVKQSMHDSPVARPEAGKPARHA